LLSNGTLKGALAVFLAITAHLAKEDLVGKVESLMNGMYCTSPYPSTSLRGDIKSNISQGVSFWATDILAQRTVEESG